MWWKNDYFYVPLSVTRLIILFKSMPHFRFPFFYKKLFGLKIIRWIVRIFVWFICLSFFWVLLYKWMNPPFTYLMFERKMSAIFSGKKSSEIHYEWVSLKNVSKNLPLAVIASEDQNFSSHWGFDMDAIKKAVKHNKRHKRKRGASTISQQVAKNAFLWSGRSYLRKGLEVYFTVLIELLWSKKRIVEVYINIAEMGDRVFGAKCTAEHYFKTSPVKLNMYQCALIASVLPNPRKYKINNPGNFILKRQRWILRQMRQMGGVGYLKEL